MALLIFSLAFAVLIMTTRGLQCSVSELRSCSSYFNESECCHYRGNYLWNMRVGFESSQTLVVSYAFSV